MLARWARIPAPPSGQASPHLASGAPAPQFPFMDAIELLESQHRDLKALFQKCEMANGEAKRQLFEKIADALAVHAAIEEKHFYPATRSARSEESLQEAVDEHLSMKRLVADLLEMDPAEAQFDAR